MICSTKMFLKEERKVNCCFSIIPKGLSLDAKRNNIPIEVEGMLSEFNEITYEEMLKRLPHQRSMYHQIGFIPIFSLPNKEPHIMTPSKNEYLNR